MPTLEDWVILAERGRLVVALEAASVDRKSIFEFFQALAQQQKISCYYWNLGYDSLQEIRENSSTIISYITQNLSRPIETY